MREAAPSPRPSRRSGRGRGSLMRGSLLAIALPPGYHRLSVGDLAGETLLICAPPRCWRPALLESGGRLWGPTLQLYGVRSDDNWGIGDFGDLARIVEQWGGRGAGIVGLNPLHALFAHNPAHVSPYSPSSRLRLNTLYIDVEAVDDMRELRAGAAPRALGSIPGAPGAAARRRAGGLPRRVGREARGARAPLRALSRASPGRGQRACRRFPRLPARGRRVAARACAVRGAAGAFPCRGSQRLGLAGLARSLARPGFAARAALRAGRDRARGVPRIPAMAGRAPARARAGALRRRAGMRGGPLPGPRRLGRPGRLGHLGACATPTRSMPAWARRPTTSTARARPGACRRCGPTACARPAIASSSRRCAPACGTPAPCGSTT